MPSCLEDAIERLARLQAVTAGLAEVLSSEGAGQIVVEQAVASTNALAGAVSTLAADGQTLELVADVNLSEAVRSQLQRFSLNDSMLMAEAARAGAPIFVRSTDDGADRSPWLAQARHLGRAGSLACVPLMLGRRLVGSMGLAFDGLREFDEDEREFLLALARQCAQALERVRLYAAERKARAEAEIRGRQTAFLAHAGSILASSLDYSTTLASVAQLAVEDLADWCIIDLIGDDGVTTRLSVTHKDPAKAEYARELCQDYPLDPRWPEGIAKTLRTGESQLYSVVPDSLITAIARNPRHEFLLRALGYKSGMAVALTRRGTIIGALTFVRSTAEHAYNASDLAMAEALASRAAMAIDNARLYAQAMEAIKARDSFITVASHELRTPLSGFKLGVDVLSRILRAPGTELSDRVPVVLEKVRSQSDRLERLVSQLLDVSRLSAGRLKLELESCDLSEIVRDVAGRFADEAKQSGAEIRLQTNGAVQGQWDRLRAEQVVTNLIANALKYGRGTPVDVAVAIVAEEARLTVSDKGVGIAREDQERIFERFERAGTDRRVGGFGLGLWIVREIIRAHGGQISVESAPGQGATFLVALPLKPRTSAT